MLRHAVFFETLDRIQDETSPEWRSIFAGLVVLRLADDWLAFGPHVVTTDITGLRSVRAAIDAVPDGHSAHSILLGAVKAIEEAESADIDIVAPHLMAYGTTLVYSGLWALAIDAFEVVLEYGQQTQPCLPIAVEAAARIASAKRQSGDLAGATVAYTFLRKLAEQTGDTKHRLTADHNFAKLAAARGDLPKAEQLLEEVIRAFPEQLRADHPDFYSMVLHDQGDIARQRGQFEKAIRITYDALQITKSPRERDYRLVNLAAMFFAQGSWQIAQDAFLILMATTQEANIRWLATLNLFEISLLSERIDDFHRYRKELEAVELPPFMRTHFYSVLGQGYSQQNKPVQAKRAIQQAIALASAHGLNQQLFAAEQLLEKLEKQDTICRPTRSLPAPASVNDIAVAITDLKTLAHAGS